MEVRIKSKIFNYLDYIIVVNEPPALRWRKLLHKLSNLSKLSKSLLQEALDSAVGLQIIVDCSNGQSQFVSSPYSPSHLLFPIKDLNEKNFDYQNVPIWDEEHHKIVSMRIEPLYCPEKQYRSD